MSPRAKHRNIQIWRNISEKVFEHTKNAKFVEKNGLYDKLIIAHSFKEDLENNKLAFNDEKIEDACQALLRHWQ